MKLIADLIHGVLSDIDNNDIIKKTRYRVIELCQEFPLYKAIYHEMS